MSDIQQLIDQIQKIDDKKELNMIYRAWDFQNKKTSSLLYIVVGYLVQFATWIAATVYLSAVFITQVIPEIQTMATEPIRLMGFTFGVSLSIWIMIIVINGIGQIKFYIQDYLTMKRLDIKFNK